MVNYFVHFISEVPDLLYFRRLADSNPNPSVEGQTQVQFQTRISPESSSRSLNMRSGRFEVLSVDKWKHSFTVTAADMGGCGCCGPLMDNKFLPEKTG